MTPSDITRIGEALYGKNWKSPLARRLGTSHRTVFSWSVGEHRPRGHYVSQLEALKTHAESLTMVDAFMALGGPGTRP